jgi:hypothetical protein
MKKTEHAHPPISVKYPEKGIPFLSEKSAILADA